MSNRGNEDTHKIHVQIHTGQPGNLRGGGRAVGGGGAVVVGVGGAGYSWLPTMLPVFFFVTPVLALQGFHRSTVS